jgi:elongation factor G
VCLKVEHVAAPTRPSSTAWASCTCACCWSGCASSTSSRSTRVPPRIAYRETATAAAEGHHRHKKQTGGAGQFGEVFLRIEPLPRGAGFEFVDAVKGGTIPGQFIPAVEKGVREVLATARLPATRWWTCAWWSTTASTTAWTARRSPSPPPGRKAFMDAIAKARALVLEPIVGLEISAPDHAMGDITGDLAARAAWWPAHRTSRWVRCW